MHSLLTLNFASTNFFEFEEMDMKNHPQIDPLFRHGRRHARIYSHAFNARKSRATSTEGNEDEEDADEHSYISEGTLPAY